MGGSPHESGGEIFSPWQLYLSGMASSNPQASLQSSKGTGVGGSIVGLGGTGVFVTVGWSGVDVSVGRSGVDVSVDVSVGGTVVVVGGTGVDVMTSALGALLHPVKNITTSANPVICFIIFGLFIV